ncbi:MAG: DUF2318 domain-containing protein [Candidatus Aenigmarchaeota archaeon]|nr:DUF2318 domain-containing protein [Candidatus Aenigmarchaeota archaeon]
MNKIFAGIGVLVIIAVIALVPGMFGTTGNIVTEGAFTIPITEISETAKFYEYDSNGVTVRFFVVKANDGNIKTAFDACDVCYRSKKGYRQDGEYMVCNNCGNKYPITGLGTENRNPGGCWPSYLASIIIGNELIIQKSDIDKGRTSFA